MEPYLTIKELQAKLASVNLPSSRTFVELLRKDVKFVCNRAKWSDVLAFLENRPKKKVVRIKNK